MKVTSRFMIRAALVLSAGGALGAFGACKDNSAGPTPPPPPPPPPIAAPTALAATTTGATSVALGWTDNANNETGFRLERCSGAGCTNFAQVGTNLAANAVTFTDEGLTASTAYSYRIRAFNATDTSAFSNTLNVTTTAVTASPSFTMAGAGEISTCNSNAGPVATSLLVKNILAADTSAIAFTVGNNLADMTPGSTFQSCFVGKGWDDFRSKTWYAIGTGDFGTDRGPDGVYGYLGDRTGPAHKGWFSFDKGSWHVVVLNTSDWEHGSSWTFGIDPQLNRVPSEQVDWLTADLAATTKPCIAVISWERRLYTTSGGGLGRNSNMLPMGNIMHDFGVDVLISAKDKLYARFAKANPTDGSPDATRGLRQFIVGTGGRTLDSETPPPGPTLREAEIRQWGVLKLTMAENSYSWEFISTVPGGATDTGTAQCNQ
ncbi:MAG TPA: hypothetical protein VGQ48_06665 [Gemmatimonadales bacterium]|jgi:hypothetical protein|nr:hypothetical protein [Gemmatimonadales bacterium]